MTESDSPRWPSPSGSAPDFSREALAHLQVHSDAFALHVQSFLDSPNQESRQTLREDLQRFRNVLVLLDKAGAVYVADELLALIAADEQGRLSDQSELARVLLLAADHLSLHVAWLQQDETLESALSLLPLVNDSRACRDEALLSDVLVLAAGIELPLPKPASVTDESWEIQRSQWVQFATREHAEFARCLLAWWRGADVSSARALSTSLNKLCEYCQSRPYLDVLVPLFQSAILVVDAIAINEINDGPALRSLYAQLERYIHRCMLIATPEDLLPGDLLRNFLYYVAQSESNAPAAVELRQRFRLDKVRQASSLGKNQKTPTIGVGYHLANAIRASVATETQALHSWLDQPVKRENFLQLVRLKVRLSQLEPVLTLMGAPEALVCLNRINADLKTLKDDAVPDAQMQMRLAESLLELDALLDKTARHSVTRVQCLTNASLVAEDVFVDMAVDACLREARHSLQSVADKLDSLLAEKGVSSSRYHALITQLIQIDQSLQILPLPEVSPLLRGLADLLARSQLEDCREIEKPDAEQAREVQRQVQQAIATLLVSVDYYLGCVLQPQASASQLLVDAEESLILARTLLDGNAANMPVNLSDAEWEEQVRSLLPAMDALGASLVNYRNAPSGESVSHIRSALDSFEGIARMNPGSPIHVLACASQEWFYAKGPEIAELQAEELALLDEVHAVIPQLIDQLLSGSDSVRGFDDLIDRLQHIEALDEADLFDDTGGLTLNVDEDLLFSFPDETEAVDLDQTLQHVFYHECVSHLEALDESVRSARQHTGDEDADQLPSEQMLRALHTLSGSAQTVDAHHIVNIVQPLQRAALARQRTNDSFDEAETQYIGELVTALRARLDALVSGHDVGQSVKAIEQRLGDFLAASIPGTSGLKLPPAPLASPSGQSLDDVFGQEADDLLERLRRIVHGSDSGTHEVREALSLLHTLKGSARMAGHKAIAEQAHSLESDVQEQSDVAVQMAALKQGYGSLSNLLSKQNTQVSLAPASPKPQALAQALGHHALTTESLMVTDTAFDALLDLATDVTVNQARLSDELVRLREVYQDIENTASRFKELPYSSSEQSGSRVKEIMADLEAARGVMRGALRQAEREQQQASRASSALQQNLIRTRLVRVDEVYERLSQTVDDAAAVVGCHVRLRLEGGETTLDRALFRQLLAPLEHLARNAVVHGIEQPVERERLGKATVGELVLVTSMDGTDLVMQFRDDGRGVQREALSELLISRGEAALDAHEDLQSVLFKSGFSSVESPNELAGHGLGLYAVQAAVEQLGGQVQLATEAGSGTQVSLRIPQRIVVNQVVLVESENVLFAFPVGHVDAVKIAGNQSGIPAQYRREALSSLLSQNVRPVERSSSRDSPVLLVTAGGQSMALDVDRIIGYRELVTQALGPQMATLKRFSGGSVLSDGRQVLILDLKQLLSQPDVTSPAKVRPAPESLRPVALIVDDSLTMRAAAVSVFQQCGFAARLARDGVEALDSMSKVLPNLILLDLEMPKLDGTNFLKRMKQEYGDVCPPVVVISSRDSQENRQRLLDMGAVRFLSKPYTKGQLLEAVEAAGLRLPDLTIA